MEWACGVLAGSDSKGGMGEGGKMKANEVNNVMLMWCAHWE